MKEKLILPRFQRLAKEGSWIIIGQITAVVGSLVLVRVLTEYLAPAQYGQLALALTLGTLTCQVSLAGLTLGVLRYYTIAAEKGDTHEYFVASRRLMLYGTYVALGLGIVLMLGHVLVGRVDWLGLIAITIVFSILGSYNSTLSMIQNAARQRLVVALHAGLDSLLKVLFAVLLLTWTIKTPEVVALGYVASLLLILGSQSVFIRRLIPRQVSVNSSDAQWVSQIWLYSKPFVYLNMFTWLQASSDRWALETFATTQDVGKYTVLMQLGYAPITILTGLIVTFISPILFQRSGDAMDSSRNLKTAQLAWQLTVTALAFTVVGSVLALLLHEWLFQLFVAKEYRSVSNLLPWMVFAGGLFAAGQVLSLKLMSDLKTGALIAPKIITALAGTLMCFGGVYIAGLNGAVFALVAFSALHFLWIGLINTQKKESF